MNKKTLFFGALCFIAGSLLAGIAVDYIPLSTGDNMYILPFPISETMKNDFLALDSVRDVHIQRSSTEITIASGQEEQISAYLSGLTQFHEQKTQLAKFNRQSYLVFGNYSTICHFDRATGNKIAMGVVNGSFVHILEEDGGCS